jgi:hypothetical protein
MVRMAGHGEHKASEGKAGTRTRYDTNSGLVAKYYNCTVEVLYFRYLYVQYHVVQTYKHSTRYLGRERLL